MENDRTNQHMIIQMKDAKLEEERIIYALWKDKKFDQVAEKLVLYFNKNHVPDTEVQFWHIQNLHKR